MPIESYAYFRVAGDAWDRPEELTSLLGGLPAEVRRVRGGGVNWSFGEQTPTDEIDIEALVRRLLAPLQDHAPTIREYVATHGLFAAVAVVVTMKAEQTYYSDGPDDAWGVPTPASAFDPETVQAIAALGAGLDIDMYVWTPEDVQEDASGSSAS